MFVRYSRSAVKPILSDHLMQRCIQRGIDVKLVYECIEQGMAKPDAAGKIRYEMDYGGRKLVVIAKPQKDKLIVVTVF